MSKYIENLTDNIINKNNYWITFGRLQKQRGTFIDLVSDELERNEVDNMTGETLGKIMCSIETGDVMIGKKELFDALHFAGGCGDLLREIVSRCLATIIWDRLHHIPYMKLPPFNSANKKIRVRHDVFDGMGEYDTKK